MKDAQERVRRFHEAMARIGARGDVGDFSDPFIEAGAAADLRSRLQLEECIELCIAVDRRRGSNRKPDAEELEELARQLRRIADQADNVATFIRVELMP